MSTTARSGGGPARGAAGRRVPPAVALLLSFLGAFTDDLDAQLTSYETVAGYTPDAPGQFGQSVDAVGGRVFAGAPTYEVDSLQAGVVFVYDEFTEELVRRIPNPSPRNGGVGAPSGHSGDGFGSSMDTFFTDPPFRPFVVIGAPFDEESCPGCSGDPDGDAGVAYIYDETTGDLVAKLEAPAPAAGDWFGFSVAAVRSPFPSDAPRLIAAGAPWLGRATATGQVHVFSTDGSSATFVRTLEHPEPGRGGGFGSAVATREVTDDLIAAAPGADRVYLLEDFGATLLHTFVNPFPDRPDGVADDFGGAVTDVFRNVVIGAPGEDGSGSDAGAAYLFDGEAGALITALEPPDPQPGDRFGAAVVDVDDRVVVGAPGADMGAGKAYVYHGVTGDLFAVIDNPISLSRGFGRSLAAGTGRILVGDDPQGALVETVLAFEERSPPPADLAVELSGPPCAVNAGSTAVYRIELFQLGPEVATNTIVRVEVPPELGFDPGASSPECAAEPTGAVCSLGNLPESPEPRELTVSFDVAPGVTLVVDAVAEARSDLFDPSPADNRRTHRVEVVLPEGPGINPDGWIRARGWNLLLPLLNDLGCAGGDERGLGRNWLAPHDVSEEDPRPGDVWGDIDFLGVSPAFGYDIGGLFPAPTWLSAPFLEATFGLPPGDVPDGDVVDFRELVSFLNGVVVPVAGGTRVPDINVLGVATTYVRNRSTTALPVEICTASDDAIRVFLNNIEITREAICRPLRPFCEESRPAVLPPGVSKVAVLVWQGVGGWGFRLGIREPGGDLLADGRGCVEFLGTGDDETEGASQFEVVRSSPAGDICGCEESVCGCLCPVPEPRTEVTLAGRGPGSIEGFIEVEETFRSRAAAAIDVECPPGFTPGEDCRIRDLFIFPDPEPIDGEEEEGFRFQGRNVVGHDAGGGSTTTFDGVTYHSISTTGGDIWNCGDDFEFAYSIVGGDFDISVQIVDRVHETDQGRWGKFGLMARQSLDRDSRFTMVQDHLPLAEADDDARFAGRRQHGAGCGGMYEIAGPGGHPMFLRLTRRGSVVEGWFSDNPGLGDGTLNPREDVHWTPGFQDDWGPLAPRSLYVGFANSEHNSAGAARQTVSFRLLCRQGVCLEGDATGVPSPAGKVMTLTGVRGTQLEQGITYGLSYADDHFVHLSGRIRADPTGAAISGLEALAFNPGQTGRLGIFENSHDIGNPGLSGETTLVAPLGKGDGGGAGLVQDGSFQLTAPRNPTDDTLDQLRYLYVSQSGDFDFRARFSILSGGAGGRSGRFGVMARHTCDPSAKYSFMLLGLHGEGQDPQSAEDPRFAYRVMTGDQSTRDDYYVVDRISLPAGQPTWMRILRYGKAVYGYLSEDDGGEPEGWILVGSDVDPSRPDTLLVGIGLESHRPGASGQIEADEVSLTTFQKEEIGETCDEEAGAVISDEYTGQHGADHVVVRNGSHTPTVVGGRLRLTESGMSDSSVQVWYCTDRKLADCGFKATFDAFMNAGGGTAGDGLTFTVVQGRCDDPQPLQDDLELADLGGAHGGLLGFEAGTLGQRVEGHPNFAIELDNWYQGGGQPPNETSMGGSPNYDGQYHLGIDINSNTSSLQTNHQKPGLTGSVPDVFSVSGVSVEVEYRPNGDIFAWATPNDGSQGRTLVLCDSIPPLEGELVLGFTASTGGASCRQEIDDFVVKAIHCGGLQLPSDCNLDGLLDLSDAVCLLRHLFVAGRQLPCGESPEDRGNRKLLDLDASGAVNITDAINLLNYLFLGADPPALGIDCVRMPGCPEAAGCQPEGG